MDDHILSVLFSYIDPCTLFSKCPTVCQQWHKFLFMNSDDALFWYDYYVHYFHHDPHHNDIPMVATTTTATSLTTAQMFIKRYRHTRLYLRNMIQRLIQAQNEYMRQKYDSPFVSLENSYQSDNDDSVMARFETVAHDTMERVNELNRKLSETLDSMKQSETLQSQFMRQCAILIHKYKCWSNDQLSIKNDIEFLSNKQKSTILSVYNRQLKYQRAEKIDDMWAINSNCQDMILYHLSHYLTSTYNCVIKVKKQHIGPCKFKSSFCMDLFTYNGRFLSLQYVIRYNVLEDSYVDSLTIEILASVDAHDEDESVDAHDKNNYTSLLSCTFDGEQDKYKSIGYNADLLFRIANMISPSTVIKNNSDDAVHTIKETNDSENDNDNHALNYDSESSEDEDADEDDRDPIVRIRRLVQAKDYKKNNNLYQSPLNMILLFLLDVILGSAIPEVHEEVIHEHIIERCIPKLAEKIQKRSSGVHLQFYDDDDRDSDDEDENENDDDAVELMGTFISTQNSDSEDDGEVDVEEVYQDSDEEEEGSSDSDEEGQSNRHYVVSDNEDDGDSEGENDSSHDSDSENGEIVVELINQSIESVEDVSDKLVNKKGEKRKREESVTVLDDEDQHSQGSDSDDEHEHEKESDSDGEEEIQMLQHDDDEKGDSFDTKKKRRKVILEDEEEDNDEE